MLFDLLFRWFFTAYALAGGVSVGFVLFVLGSAAGTPVSLGTAALAAIAAAAGFRAGTLVFRRDPARLSLVDRLGRAVAAGAFVALASALTTAVAVVACAALERLGSSAQAGMLGPPGAGRFANDGLAVLAAAVALAGGTMAHGYLRGYRALALRTVEVPLRGLPPALAGLRLVHLSDLHLGPLADVRLLREVIARIRALDPDLVCVTGDIVDNASTDLLRWVPELAHVRARHGVLAVLGNHDRHVGADRVAEALGTLAGWRVLRDEAAVAPVRGHRLHVLGLADGHAAPPAGLAALARAVPAGELWIALAHYPGTFRWTAAAGAALTLAGHTHGGQVAVPGLPWLNPARLLMTRWDGGLFAEGAAWLHVSRGVGTGCQRIRVGVPAEITVLTLVAAPAARAA